MGYNSSCERLPVAAEVIEDVKAQLDCFLEDNTNENVIRSFVSEALTIPEAWRLTWLLRGSKQSNPYCTFKRRRIAPWLATDKCTIIMSHIHIYTCMSEMPLSTYFSIQQYSRTSLNKTMPKKKKEEGD